MFSEELKKSTLVEHAELEKKLVLWIKNIRDVSGYADLLKLMYGFYKPLQDSFFPLVSHGAGGTDFSLRISELIINDLHHVDPGPDHEIPLCSNIPEINTIASSMGAMYVTEGSTLGGKIITKMISRQLNISPVHGFSFFNAYGDETLAKWEKFKEILNMPRSDNERIEMISTAKKTFSAFKIWISENERN